MKSGVFWRHRSNVVPSMSPKPRQYRDSAISRPFRNVCVLECLALMLLPVLKAKNCGGQRRGLAVPPLLPSHIIKRRCRKDRVRRGCHHPVLPIRVSDGRVKAGAAGLRRPVASTLPKRRPISLTKAEHYFALLATHSRLAFEENSLVLIMSGMGRSSQVKRRAKRAGRF
jgi:hypothetical protein